MILHYFFNKENKHKDNILIIYNETIISVKKIASKNFVKSPKDFNLTFEITSLLLFAIFYGCKKSKDKNDYIKKNQELMNFFISDIDHSLRLSGIGDMSIGKYVKNYVKKFYFRISELESIFSNADKNIDNFKKYLINYKVCTLDSHEKQVNLFFIDIQTLVLRCSFKKFDNLIYSELFK